MSTAAALNLKQVAARLGVHYMTAYRYVRQGHLEAELVGTQWQVAGPALEEFLAARQRFDGPPAGAKTPVALRGVDWAGRLERSLLAGDEPAAWRVLESALAAGRPALFCYLDVIGAALGSIGSRWEAGELGVADQHVATAVAIRLVARLGARFRRPGRSRGNVVFGAPTGELHSLPIAIAADVVRLAGFDVLELGANVPPEAFAAAAERASRLVVVGIGITSLDHLRSVQRTLSALSVLSPAPPVVIGGSAAGAAAGAGLTGVDGFAIDGRHAVALVEDLARPRRRQERLVVVAERARR